MVLVFVVLHGAPGAAPWARQGAVRKLDLAYPGWSNTGGNSSKTKSMQRMHSEHGESHACMARDHLYAEELSRSI